MLPDWRCSTSSTRAVVGSEPVCPPECNRYKGTMDVLYKVTRQVSDLMNLFITYDPSCNFSQKKEVT